MTIGVGGEEQIKVRSDGRASSPEKALLIIYLFNTWRARGEETRFASL
jgi:hypothetical protein